MPNITNVKRAFNQISAKSLENEHEGELTRDVFMGFFNDAVSDFNLNALQVEELKFLKYPVEVINPDETESSDEQPQEAREITEDDIFESVAKVELLEVQVAKLTSALAKIGTLTGYGNHLREFGIDRWEPTRKDLQKYG